MDGKFLAANRKSAGYKQTITLSFCSEAYLFAYAGRYVFIIIGGLTYGLKKMRYINTKNELFLVYILVELTICIFLFYRRRREHE